MFNKLGEWKGNPTISLAKEAHQLDTNAAFTFGKAKAELIVQNFEAILSFVEKHGDAAAVRNCRERMQRLAEEKVTAEVK